MLPITLWARYRVSLHSTGCPRACPVDQAGFRFRDLPFSTSSAGIKGIRKHTQPNYSIL